MMVQDIVLHTLPWSVRVYYAVDTYYADEIIDDLICLGCRGENLRNAKESLWKGELNSGITYTDNDNRQAVVVIGKTTSGAEFFNSLLHEVLHLLSYIAKAEGLNPYGEDVCYMAGELAQKMYGVARGLLCDCCREKTYKKLW